MNKGEQLCSIIEKLINVIGTPDIKVITGVRRNGNPGCLTIYLSPDLYTIISILSI